MVDGRVGDCGRVIFSGVSCVMCWRVLSAGKICVVFVGKLCGVRSVSVPTRQVFEFLDKDRAVHLGDFLVN